MKGIRICRRDDAPAGTGHPIAAHTAEATASRVISPHDYSLWMVEIMLPAGARVELPQVHGDEIVYIQSGTLSADGVDCPAGGAVVIESEAHPALVAVAETTLLHMGPSDSVVPSNGHNGPITRVPDQVHVVGQDGWLALNEPGMASKYYADSTCDGCRATLLFTSREKDHVAPPHSHTTDELIHVLRGELQLGAHVVRPGDTLAIEANQRYSFRTSGAFGYLNYRRDASMHVSADGSAPRMEGGLLHGMKPVAVT